MSKQAQAKTTTESSTQTVSPTALTPELLQQFVAFLGEDDLMLCFDIRLLSPQGEVFQIKGNSSFPQATRPGNKGMIPSQFDNVMADSLVKPLLHRFNDYIQENVVNVLEPPRAVDPLAIADKRASSPLDSNGTQEENAPEDTPPDQGTIP